MSTWYGVTVSGGRVTRLYLRDNNIAGPLPAEIGNLTNLTTTLDLRYNQLTGTIPAELVNLTNLLYLHLNHNDLTGSIPAELGNLANLIQLILYNNQLTGSIPTELGNLANLTHLWLFSNQLTGSIPSELVNLTNLTTLNLNLNQLTGSIPVELGNFTALTDLQLGGNQLTGAIPTELGNLANLIQLILYNNQLTGSIPAELGNLANLTRLYLFSNQLTGAIPTELGNLANLTHLLLSFNQLTALPDLNSLTALTYFNISSNKLTFEDLEPNVNVASNFIYSPQDSVGVEKDTTLSPGASLTLSVAVGGTANQYQWLKDGWDITGANNDSLVIPSVDFTDAGSYILLTTNTIATALTLTSRPMHVSVDGISSALEFDSLALVTLYDSTDGASWNNNTNWFTGTVDTWYGVTVSEGRVTGLDLNLNNLSGAFPAEIGNLTGLTQLDLNNNQLTGPIPTEIGSLTSLTWLDLNNNQLTGSIPTEIGSLTSLHYLYLYNNQLTGAIPVEIGSLTSLTQLQLYNNQLTGAIPTEIGNLANMQYLYLYNNQLVDLPDLSSLSALRILYIQNNQFTFEDIEPNIGVPSYNFIYSPQDSVGSAIDTTVYVGSNLTLSVSVGGTANQYQWKKEGEDIVSATNDTLELTSLVVADSGNYNLQITNTIAIGLTLYSRPIHVTVSDTTAPAAPQNLTAVAFDSVKLNWDANNESDLWYYTIYRDITSDSTAADSIASVLKPDTTYADATVTIGITYYYWITAVDSSRNESNFSVGVSAFPNVSPVWTLADTSFVEDDSLNLDLDDWVSDENDPDSTLTITVSGGSNISAFIDSITHIIKFETYPDLSGFYEQFILTATDPYGLSAKDTIIVTVLPVNDAPDSFDLVSPDDNTIVGLTNDNLGEYLTFEWQTSFDVDGDTITYSVLFTDNLDLLSFNEIQETEVSIMYDSVLSIMNSNALTILEGTWTVAAYDEVDSTLATNGPFSLIIDGSQVSVTDEINLPAEFALHQNYPNPFNPVTTLRYDLPENSFVNITIYDLLGRQVKTLVNQTQEAGYRSVMWNATNAYGKPVSAGVYLYKIQAGVFVQTKKMILLK